MSRSFNNGASSSTTKLHQSSCNGVPERTIEPKDTPDNDEIESQLQTAGLVEPPDGGYGWAVVAGVFLAIGIVDGLVFTAGQCFAPEWEREFDTGRGPAVWPVSLTNGFSMLTGPFVSALVNYYGCRVIAMVGTLFIVAGLLMSLLARSVAVLCVTFGAIAGTGFGMVYLPSVVIVSYYFQNRRALATGIALCGAGIGIFAFGPLLDWLMTEFTWRQTMFIVAGIALNMLVAAALYRPLQPSTENYDEVEELAVKYQNSITNDLAEMANGTAEASRQNLDRGRHAMSETRDTNHLTVPPVQNAGINAQAPQQTVSNATLNKGPNTDTEFGLLRRRHTKSRTDNSTPFKHALEATARHRASMAMFGALHAQSRDKIYRMASRDCVNSLNRPLSRMDIFYSGSRRSLARRRSTFLGARQAGVQVPLDRGYGYLGQQSTSMAARINQPEVEEKYDAAVSEAGSTSLSWKENITSALIQLLDFSLLKSPTFLLMTLCGFLGKFGFFVPFIFLKRAAVSAGVPKESAMMLISILGAVSIFARLVCGWLSDHPKIDVLVVNNITVAIAGLATMLVPWLTSSWMFIVYSTVFGFGAASSVALQSVICVELLGLERLTSAFGLAFLFMGVALLLGPPVAGTVTDMTGDYDAAFYLMGASIAASGVLGFSLRTVARYEYGGHKGTPSNEKMDTVQVAASCNQIAEAEIAHAVEVAAKDENMQNTYYTWPHQETLIQLEK